MSYGDSLVKSKFTHRRQIAALVSVTCGRFLSIDPITKLMPTFLVGKRDHYHATAFMEDLAGRLNNRIQLSTDGLNAYADAVERAFGAEIDYAQIVKEYASPSREDQRKS